MILAAGSPAFRYIPNRKNLGMPLQSGLTTKVGYLAMSNNYVIIPFNHKTRITFYLLRFLFGCAVNEACFVK